MSTYLLIDLEATCNDDGSLDRTEMEIIEIGAVMVDETTLQAVSEFGSLVRPIRHPQLTGFCTQLTSITQQDVDSAKTFPHVLARFRAWIYEHDVKAWGSWGNYDRYQFQQDCELHQATWPFSFEHMNFKELFKTRHRQKKRVGLAGCVARAGLTFLGTHHRGIDDARNIAQLMPFLVGDAVLPAVAQGPNERQRGDKPRS